MATSVIGVGGSTGDPFAIIAGNAASNGDGFSTVLANATSTASNLNNQVVQPHSDSPRKAGHSDKSANAKTKPASEGRKSNRPTAQGTQSTDDSDTDSDATAQAQTESDQPDALKRRQQSDGNEQRLTSGNTDPQKPEAHLDEGTFRKSSLSVTRRAASAKTSAEAKSAKGAAKSAKTDKNPTSAATPTPSTSARPATPLATNSGNLATADTDDDAAGDDMNSVTSLKAEQLPATADANDANANDAVDPDASDKGSDNDPATTGPVPIEDANEEIDGDATAIGDHAAGQKTAAVAAKALDSLNATAALATASDAKPAAAPTAAASAPATPTPTPNTQSPTQFVDDNHANVVHGITGRLLPNGGEMSIKLDPPELGDLQVTVKMQDGQMTASFQTSNEQATRLLGHSLSQLKSSLESAGVAVEKLHVTQMTTTTKSGGSNSSDSRQDKSSDRQGSGNSSSEREQQRREMLQKMWRRISGGSDPLDLVA